MARSLLKLALPCLLAALACDGRGVVTAPDATQRVESSVSGGFDGETPVDTGLLERMVNADLQTRYQGERRLEFRYYEGGVSQALEYTESVASDGAGSFAIDTLEVVTPMADPDLFKLVQNTRQVFTYRFRDFKVTNRRLFSANYRLRVVSTSRQVAGVAAVELSIERKTNPLCHYRVHVEPRTGLVLRWESRDLSGALCGLMEFQSIDFDPDLSGVALVDRNYDSQLLDPDAADVDATVGFSVIAPRLVPQGYELLEARTLVVELGDRWVVYSYTDGVTHVVFAHGAPEPGQPLTENDPRLGKVNIVQMGLWNVVNGRLGGRAVFALGQVDEDELFEMLQSAF